MPPAPKPNARRRNKENSWTLLPASCTLPAPAWPLPDKATKAELAVWRKVWKLAVANRWHRIGCSIEVALYVRQIVHASAGSIAATAEVRQLGAQLGTTPIALTRQRLAIDADDRPADRPARKSPTGKYKGIRLVQ